MTVSPTSRTSFAAPSQPLGGATAWRCALFFLFLLVLRMRLIAPNWRLQSTIVPCVASGGGLRWEFSHEPRFAAATVDANDGADVFC